MGRTLGATAKTARERKADVEMAKLKLKLTEKDDKLKEQAEEIKRLKKK